MSIQCNLRALKEAFREVMKSLLAVNSDIADLKHQFKEQYTQIKWEYQFIKWVLKRIKKKHNDLHKKLMNVKKSLKDNIDKTY